jgi:hypothetical protein
MSMSSSMSAARVSLAVVALTAVAAAQVPLTDEPMHRAVYANGTLRVLDVLIPAGQATLDHRHDRDLATISMNGDAETRVLAPGQAAGAVRPRRPVGDAAVAEYVGAATSHRIENVGAAPYHLFAVENLREGGWSAAAAVTGALGTRLTNDNRAFRTYDVRMGRDAAQTSHTHAVPTVVVLVSGLVMSEGPDAQAKAFAPASVGMKQLAEPGQWLLVPAGDTHHLVRLSNGEARVVEIEVR